VRRPVRPHPEAAQQRQVVLARGGPHEPVSQVAARRRSWRGEERRARAGHSARGPARSKCIN
jgi:hypothetical protein